MTAFQLHGPPLLSRSTIHRPEPLFEDTDARAKLWPDGRLLLVDQAGCVPVRAAGTKLVYQRAGDYAETIPVGAVLLGEQDGAGYWALRHTRDGSDERPTWRVWDGPEPTEDEQWLDLRAVGGLLDDTDAGVFTSAQAVLNWYRIGAFCAKCGSPVEYIRAGWASHCTGCGREEYPRTDPAVICLVHDGEGENGSHVLLARQPSWPRNRYSVLAGFVEAGESLEDCVEREIGEEVGLAVRDVRYLGNQPWPFPRSLMIGFTAIADRSAPLLLADGEIAEAKWVSRERVQAALAEGGAADGFGLPGGVSIARHMVEAWAQAE
ncbi:MAG TPA: NAD(+) diphosphatase [Pseudonocardiaceae bacterium]|nr:NAD(+) diphosphatase [Pseudonocardiaceae bacterium]